MNLVECPTCGHSLSRQADQCPGCGHPMAWQKTSGGQALLFGIAVALTYAGYHYLQETLNMPWWGWLIAFGILAGGLMSSK